MGHDIRIGWGSGPVPLAPLLAKLASDGLPCIVVLVEGNLQAPHTPPPTEWREVRLKCEKGMVTLKRESDGIHVKSFGNADDALREAQQKVAAALQASADAAAASRGPH